jgi:hypothetical protein
MLQENLGTAKLKKYRVSMLDFFAIKSMFANQIFNRKEQDGYYYILADKEQVSYISKSRISLTEVPNTI